MAKIHNHDLVLDNNDCIRFTDNTGTEHTIFWDDLLDRFVLDSDVQATTFIDVTDAVVETRNPNGNDSGYKLPTLWVDTSTNECFICTNNTVGASVWILCSGGGSGTGSITIKDEGSVINTDTKILNFIGDTVTAYDSGSPNEVNIYIPPLEYVSHWNTNDGSNNNTISDISTTQRILSNPLSAFNIGDWTIGNQYPTINNSSISYSSPNKCLFDDTSTTFTVNVYDADGSSLLATHTQSNIIGNLNQTSQNIQIVISNWESEFSKYKANIDVTIAIDSIIPNGGRFSIEIIHNSGSSSYTKSQSDIFYDSDVNSPTIGSISISEDTINSNKYLSGLHYYSTNDTFSIAISAINNINDRSYVNNFVYLNSSTYGITDRYLTGSNLTNWNNNYNNTNASYNQSLAINRTNYRYIGNTASIRTRWIDWITGSYVNSPTDSILIDTVPANSTLTAEYFNDENYRYTSSFSSWNSQSLLGSNDLMIIEGTLKRQYGDWRSYSPSNTANYTSTNNQFYYREFKHDNTAHTNGQFRITGISETDISNNDVVIEISLDNVDWYIVNDPYLSGALADGDGCRTNVGTTSLPLIDFTLGTGGTTSSSTGPTGWGIYFRISIPNGSSVEIGEIIMTNWN